MISNTTLLSSSYLFVNEKLTSRTHSSLPSIQRLQLTIFFGKVASHCVSVHHGLLARGLEHLLVITFIEFSIDPRALNSCVSSCQRTRSMRFIIKPLTVVHIAVRIPLLSHSMHHPIFELPNILTHIGPSHLAHAAWLILFKFSLVNLSGVCEVVLTCSVEHAVNKLSRIGTTFASKCTRSRLLTINEVARILDLVVVPVLSTLTMLLIFLPHTFIKASLCIAKCARAVGHSGFPLALVDITIGMRHSAKSFKLAVL